jgi:transcriptional regulator with XRE-family HTH domain
MGDVKGRRLKAARQLAGLNQKQLSERLGVHQAFLSRVEKGLNDGTVDFWREAAEVLDVSLDYLLGKAPSPPPREEAQGAKPITRRALVVDYTTPAGLRALALDETLIEALHIADEEWARLAAIPLPRTVPKEGYLHLLLTLRHLSRLTDDLLREP